MSQCPLCVHYCQGQTQCCQSSDNYGVLQQWGGWRGMEPPTCAREIASSTGSKSQRHRVRKSIRVKGDADENLQLLYRCEVVVNTPLKVGNAQAQALPGSRRPVTWSLLPPGGCSTLAAGGAGVSSVQGWIRTYCSGAKCLSKHCRAQGRTAVPYKVTVCLTTGRSGSDHP